MKTITMEDAIREHWTEGIRLLVMRRMVITRWWRKQQRARNRIMCALNCLRGQPVVYRNIIDGGVFIVQDEMLFRENTLTGVTLRTGTDRQHKLLNLSDFNSGGQSGLLTMQHQGGAGGGGGPRSAQVPRSIDEYTEASSLGSAEAKQVRESVHPDVGRAIAIASKYLGQREELIQNLRNQLHHAEDNGHILDRDCQGVEPGQKVPAVRISHIRGVINSVAD